MIELPEFTKAFEYENGFYLTCKTQRISKLLAHYELFKRVNHLAGAIVECGVFKGASFLRWAHFREMFGGHFSREIIGFDIFGEFPETDFQPDQKKRASFIEKAGDQSISVDQLNNILEKKNMNQRIKLQKGDITEQVPKYLEEHPELSICLLNLDTDIYEPSVTVLEYLYPRIVPGGILILDDYAVFPGETTAVDQYFKDRDVSIQKLPFAMTPSFIVKE